MENNSRSAFCPIRDVITHLSDKWSMLVIITLSNIDKMRFNEIHKEIDDISQRMLSVTLRSLEKDGLVDRKVYPEVPPRVEYKLTELGHSLLQPLGELITWAQNNTDTINLNRKNFEEK